MGSVSRVIAADAERVFAVLGDGWQYPTWVVGAARMRDVDAGWPAPGTRLHHSVGAWPLFIHDQTTVLEIDRPRMLLLDVGVWPVGRGHVRFTLRPAGTAARTEVTMAEQPAGGPARWLHNPVAEAVLNARNRETLLRLSWLAERAATRPPA